MKKISINLKEENVDSWKENMEISIDDIPFRFHKVEIKYCLYSDEDEPKEEMFKRFIEDTKSVGMYLKYYNHFDGYHRIYKIPELTELDRILKEVQII